MLQRIVIVAALLMLAMASCKRQEEPTKPAKSPPVPVPQAG
ncbi:MAG TPA: hypothetical protein VIL86_00335 [Tepidisphaeraceae bacterium]|jgi:hypothetical protein